MERTAEEGEPVDPRPSDPNGCTAGPWLAADLRALRALTGKSLKELEQLIHASDSSISRYLSGRIVPPWPVIERLCRLAEDEPARLRPLWEHVNDDRHRQGECPPPPLPESPAVEAPPETGDQALPGRRPAARGRLVIGGLLAATAVIFGGAGVLVGLWLAPDPRPAPLVQQFAACSAWPWPVGSTGQVAVPPAQVHGRDHIATVQLLTRSIGGQEMVWAQISHARYGDRVWMDWSQNGGKTWTQCGPFTTTGAIFASRAHQIGPGWKFRACGDTPRPTSTYSRDACTTYW